MGAYLRPTASMRRWRPSPGRAVLAGGTDYYPARVGRPLDDDVLDITASPRCAGSRTTREHWRIGAGTTWTELIERRCRRCFDGLKLAAREVGGVQIQNAGTLAGNLCNASPAADGMPNLLALDAEVELASPRGRRRLPLGEFVTGNRQTRAGPTSWSRRSSCRASHRSGALAFLKLGARRYLVISIVMVAAVIEVDRRPGRRGAHRRRLLLRRWRSGCRRSRRRLPARCIEAGSPSGRRPTHLAALSPIDDVRGQRRLSPRRRVALVRARAAMRRGLIEAPMQPSAFTVNGARGRRGRPAGHAAGRRAARGPRPHRHQGRLQRRRLRRLHGAARRRAGLRLPGAVGQVEGRAVVTVEGLAPTAS